MIISDLFNSIDAIKPNSFPVAAKLQWLNEVEGLVWTEVMLLAPDEYRVYTEEDFNKELLVKAPHDDLYWPYLAGLIDFANGDYDRFQNSVQLYNERLRRYKRWYTDTYRPADGELSPTYPYLSAYGIAKKYGYSGTEEEWVTSLKGNPGPKGEPFKYEDFTPAQLASLRGPQGPEGPRGPQGAPGPQGPKGDTGPAGADGRSLVIKDVYATLDQLRAAFPNGNENAYQVTAENNEIFIWSASKLDWVTMGAIQGPTGAQGETGPQGEPGPAGATGPQGPQGVSITSIVKTSGTGAPGTTDVYTITLSDGNKATFNVYNGNDAKGDMLAANYDPTNSVKNAGGIDKYVSANTRADTWIPTAEDVGAQTFYSSLSQLGLTIGSETIEAIAQTMTNHSVLVCSTSGSNADIYPVSDRRGSLIVYRTAEQRITFEWAYMLNGKRWIGYYTTSTTAKWSGWKEVLHSGNFADYAVNKAGDIVTGDITRTRAGVNAQSEYPSPANIATTDDITTQPSTAISHINADGRRFQLAFNEYGVCLWDSTNDKRRQIFHTGNKPSGSYTGNGSATLRSIATGGIGHAVMVWSDKGVALVMRKGVIGTPYGTTTVVAIPVAQAYVMDGTMNMATTNELLNANGVTYNYQVL